MTNVPRYSYGLIEATQIRLLKLLKIDKDSISSTLQDFSITQNLEPLPQCTALSYMWSSDRTRNARSGRISIDGRQLHVLDSLQLFFEMLQTKETLLDDGWWCIDLIFLCLGRYRTKYRGNLRLGPLFSNRSRFALAGSEIYRSLSLN